MARTIETIAVIGGGTMGSGIAGLCAQRDKKVLLLEINRDAAETALERIKNGRPPAVDYPEQADTIEIGTIEDDLSKVAECDWICEAVFENLETKRAVIEKLEPLRRDGSIVSSNTSGIPLRDITDGMPQRLKRDFAVTHFFNPVKVMRLLELVPGKDTSPDVITSLSNFCRNTLGKGVVNAKDTVNFIGNRIGCYWMMMGLHQANQALKNGLTMEEIDAQMSAPMGLPPTGLYGLIDLIGLDVMDLVGENLAANLPLDDLCTKFTRLPVHERAMLERGQIGRKAGAGFYRIEKLEDGTRKTEVYDLTKESWRNTTAVQPDKAHSVPSVMFVNDEQGRLAWQIMGGTLIYAAGLIPEIADDVVNIDRAMKWGYAWNWGPFEMLDEVGPMEVIKKIKSEGQSAPKMLQVLKNANAKTFYRNAGKEFLGLDGQYHPTPEE